MINLLDHAGSIFLAVVTALIGAIGFLVRKIFTNEKQIAILQTQVDHNKSILTEMRADIKNLIAKFRE